MSFLFNYQNSEYYTYSCILFKTNFQGLDFVFLQVEPTQAGALDGANHGEGE
jgi:hypothetical protein